MKTQILFVDDHPAFLDAYKSYTSDIENIEAFFTDNCDKAFDIVLQQDIKILFVDLLFDNNTIHAKIESGEALIRKVRKVNQDCKIAIATSFSKMSTIQKVLKLTNPNAYLVKTEIRKEEIAIAIRNLLENKIYYSPTVYNKQQKKAQFVIHPVSVEIASQLHKFSSIKELAQAKVIINQKGKILKQRRIEAILSELREDLNVTTNLQLILKLEYLGIIPPIQFTS